MANLRLFHEQAHLNLNRANTGDSDGETGSRTTRRELSDMTEKNAEKPVKNLGGRPTLAQQREKRVQQVQEQLKQLTPELYDLLTELARGVWYEDSRGKVYRVKPDRQAIETLLAYSVGKPADRTELSGPNGGPIQTTAADMTPEQRADAVRRLIESAQSRAAASMTTGETGGASTERHPTPPARPRTG